MSRDSHDQPSKYLPLNVRNHIRLFLCEASVWFCRSWRFPGRRHRNAPQSGKQPFLPVFLTSAGRPRPCAAGEVPRPGTAGLEREGAIHRRSLIMIKSERAVRQGMSFDIGNADTLNSRRKASLYQIVSAPETRGNRAPLPLSCGCIPRWRFHPAQSLLRRDHFGSRRPYRCSGFEFA